MTYIRNIWKEGGSVMDWLILDIPTPEGRKVVAQELFLAGYTVRQRKRKDGNRTVIYIEYRRE